MTRHIKNAALSMLDAGGAFSLARFIARHRLVALTYHHVLPRDAAPMGERHPNVLYVDEFARQLSYLTRHYHVVSGDELRAHLNGARLPPHSVLLTFDDGYRNNYRYAFPLLKQHGASAIFFVTSGFIGDRRSRLWFDRLDNAIATAPDRVLSWLRTQTTFTRVTLAEFRRLIKRLPPQAREALVAGVEHACIRPGADAFSKDRVEPLVWDEVREMADAGMLIGAHTATHQILASASADDVMSELVTSRNAIRTNVGRDCWCFSYPNGEAADFRDIDIHMLKASGFECAFTQIPGFADPQVNPHSLSRLGVPATANFRAFLARATGFLPLLAPSAVRAGRWAPAS